MDSELKELAEVIESALSQGKLSRLFQSSDNASSIKYHIGTLDNIIAGLSVRNLRFALALFLRKNSLG
jgi:hypothetical protein